MTLTTGQPRQAEHDDQTSNRARSTRLGLAKAKAARKPSRVLKLAGTGVSVAILCLSVFILARTLTTVNYGELRGAIQAAASRQIALALGCAACSYLALTGYDFLALRQLRLRVPYRTAALASFTSYAISFTMGFPLITAGVVRYWIYSQAGVRAGKVASLTVIAGVTFWLGMALVLGMALAFGSNGLAAVDHLGHSVNVALGAATLFGLLCYLVWVARGPRRTRISGLRLELPGLGLSLGQILLGVIDLCSASGALYVMLPAGSITFPSFAGIYVLACLIGIASNVPGGVGAFEATILNTVPSSSPEALLASLLMFRVIYYLGPFVLALALLGAHEVFQRWKGLREDMAHAQDDENNTP
jgi:glycosyltransferase 2 family protein